MAKRAADDDIDDELQPDEESNEDTFILDVRFNLSGYMGLSSSEIDGSRLPYNCGIVSETANGVPFGISVQVDPSSFPVYVGDLAKMFVGSPKFSNGSDEVFYDLAGFTTRWDSSEVQFQLDSYIDSQQMNGSTTLQLYAVWVPRKYIVRFTPGVEVETEGTMA